jgi:putative addiction module component (TIGR02574 family)
MTAVANQLIPLLEPLGVADRADLASWLIRSLDEESAETAVEGYADAWDAEIDRRMQEVREGKVVGIPAEEVFASLRQKYL